MSQRKILKQKEGSALMITIVIMAVLTVVSLLLMLVSYTMFVNASKQQRQAQAREKAQTLSVALAKEITEPVFAKYADETQARGAGQYALWFYLRDNIGQSSWPFYNAEIRNHKSADAFRYFKLKDEDDVSVCIYWESDGERNDAFPDGTNMIISVTCTTGDQSYTVKSTFELTIDLLNYEDAPSSEDDAKSKLGPKYRWRWALTERA